MISALFKTETARRVFEIFGGTGAMKAMLPEMPCWDCGSCKAPCSYPKVAELTKKLKTARKNSSLTQEGLAKLMGGIDMAELR